MFDQAPAVQTRHLPQSRAGSRINEQAGCKRNEQHFELPAACRQCTEDGAYCCRTRHDASHQPHNFTNLFLTKNVRKGYQHNNVRVTCYAINKVLTVFFLHVNKN